MIRGSSKNLYNWSCGPQVDRSVIERMHRLDRRLAVTYSPVSIDPTTSQPLETAQGLVRDPAFHLWAQDPDGNWWWVNSFPAESGFGHREVTALEADAARRMSPAEILARRLNFGEERRAKGLRAHRAYHEDLLKANRSRIANLLELDGRTRRSSDRQAKMFSYRGMSNRSTPGVIEKSAREDGWETKEEM